LSVRPGSSLAISAHLFPSRPWASTRIASSSPVQLALLIDGLRWLCQRSRHCLPMRPTRCDAISAHLFGPYSCTSCASRAASSGVHGPLTSSGSSTLCHRCMHCPPLSPANSSATFFHSTPDPCCCCACTASRSISSCPPPPHTHTHGQRRPSDITSHR